MSSLNSLPEIDFINLDADEMKTALINLYESMTGKTLAQGDGERDFVEFMAAIVIILGNDINTTGKMNLPRYSTGDYLTHLGAFRGATKNTAKAAVTTVRYTFSKTFGSIQTIPAGKRITAGGEVIFATDEDAELPTGEIFIDVPVTCTVAGETGNGFVAGQINTMVDQVDFVESVSNITESEGGAEDESEEEFAERIHEAPEGFSVAGPSGAYKYFTKEAHQSVVDVYVGSPTPGTVEVRPLLSGGVIPGQETLDTIKEYLTAEEKRPLTDNVVLVAPESVDYTVEATYYVGKSNEKQLNAIKNAVEDAGDEYRGWQKEALGRDIDPQELITLCKNAGAKRLIITTPEFIEVLDYQVAQDTSFTLTYGGVEND
ncbi:baseplate J/gp47 family protein [Ilyobacter sp.]|uniref:baseplate assembly protein n=1 Tax=Ilyobacter sp. TaxID=3100343 RepID=UPI0035644763